MGNAFIEFLKALPSILWSALAFYVVWLLRESLTGAVGRLTGFEAWGMKFSLTGGAQAMQAAFEVAEKNKKWSAQASQADQDAALALAKENRSKLEGAEILWVDDRPSNNRSETRMLRSFGCLVTFAASTDEACDALREAKDELRPFHLILSDMSRTYAGTQEPTAGLEMLKKLRAKEVTLPVIFYIGTPDDSRGVPEGAFGITHRPDQLLRLVVTALVRVRS